MLLWTSFLLAFSALLPLINPIGSALIFLGLVGDIPVAAIRSLARRIAVNNIIFLAVIELLGSAILKFFGISLPIIQVSGGLVIVSLGWSMLNQKDAQASAQLRRDEADALVNVRADVDNADVDNADLDNQELQSKAFYPLTFPVTSGPGTLVVILTLGAHASHPRLLDNILSDAGVFLAIVVLSIICYFCYAYAPRLARAVAPATVHGILRVMAFIVVSIGVQIAWNGFTALYSQLPYRT